jgi:hypothetical protein
MNSLKHIAEEVIHLRDRVEWGTVVLKILFDSFGVFEGYFSNIRAATPVVIAQEEKGGIISFFDFFH